MKKALKAVLCFMLCLSCALSLCSCGEDMSLYNTPAGNREVDKTSVKSVIENAILADCYENVKDCEVYSPAYKEIDKIEKGNKSIYYIVAGVGGYTVENGKLVRTHGISTYAAEIHLKKNNKGEYEVTKFITSRGLETSEEVDSFVDESFPEGKNNPKVIDENRTALIEDEKSAIKENEKVAQEFEFAGEDDYIELLPITNYAYEELLSYFELYPDWLGSKMRTENGVRYIYETLFQAEGDENSGVGVISFVKKTEDGTEVERTDINIDGDYVELEEIEAEDNSFDEEMEAELGYDDGIEYTPVD